MTINPRLLKARDYSFIDEPMNTYFGEVKAVEETGLWYSIEGGKPFFIPFDSPEIERWLGGLDWHPEVMSRAVVAKNATTRVGSDGTIL